jgi:hypothetical protein
MGMQVQITDPELEAQVAQWIADTGLPVEELLKDAMAGYFHEAKQIRETLDSRYDDIKSGKVKMLSSDEVEEHFRRKSAARRLKTP